MIWYETLMDNLARLLMVILLANISIDTWAIKLEYVHSVVQKKWLDDFDCPEFARHFMWF